MWRIATAYAVPIHRMCCVCAVCLLPPVDPYTQHMCRLARARIDDIDRLALELSTAVGG